MELLARVRSHATPAVLPPILFPSYHFLWKKKNVKFFGNFGLLFHANIVRSYFFFFPR